MIYALFVLILVAIFYFEWVADGVLRKITERLDRIDSRLSNLKEQIILLDDSIEIRFRLLKEEPPTL